MLLVDAKHLNKLRRLVCSINPLLPAQIWWLLHKYKTKRLRLSVDLSWTYSKINVTK